MSKETRVDLSQVQTYPLRDRANKVHIADFAQPPQAQRTFSDFLASLPNILAGSQLRDVAQAIAGARRARRAVAVALGAHVIKCGLSPVIIELMRLGVITSVALNGAGAIHDAEVALIGQTSEDVESGVISGRFGMAEETGRFLNEPLVAAWRQHGPDFPQGMGELLGRALIDIGAPYSEHSILAAGASLGVPVTVHVAIGTDIVHMHPSAHGGAIGQATFNDFQRFCGALTELGNGGVYLNIGSAVLLPEVFLKAVTIVRNLHYDVYDFVTVNLDMQKHYRSLENVVARPRSGQGRGYALIGHHELMIPLLAQSVVEIIAQHQQTHI